MPTGDVAVPVYPALSSDAAGYGTCYLLEAKAAVTLSPLAAGLGLALSFSEPLGVEVCLVRGVGLDDYVELRLWGPGLRYSSGPLQRELAALARALPLIAEENNLALPLREVLLVLASHGQGFSELAIASLFGPHYVAGATAEPVDLSGIWLVVARPRLQAERVVMALLERAAEVAMAAATLAADIEQAFAAHARIALKAVAPALAPRVRELVEHVKTMGVVGITVDATGEHLVIAVDDYGTLLDVSAVLSAHHVPHSYGRVVTPSHAGAEWK